MHRVSSDNSQPSKSGSFAIIGLRQGTNVLAGRQNREKHEYRVIMCVWKVAAAFYCQLHCFMRIIAYVRL